jgi:hypothetical protein
MPVQPISRAQWDERKALIEDALRKGYPPPGTVGLHQLGAVRVAANSLKLAAGTMQNSIHRAKILGFPPINWKLYKPEKSATITERTPDSVRTRNQIGDLQKKLTDALKHIASLEDIRKSIFGLDHSQLRIPNWQVSIDKGAKSQPEIPTLLTSDFQCGEVIRAEEIDYPNDYNDRVFSERYRRLIRTATKLLQREDPQMRYPGFIYLRAGDAISGAIHADLAESQSLTSVEQTQLVAEEEIKGLEELLKAVPQVTVYSVPGNHDRTTLKPRAKRYVALSYDELCQWTMEKYFAAKGETRIKFYAPRSGDA